MNRKTQYDPTRISTNLDIVKSNRPPNSRNKPKKKVDPRQVRIETSVLNKVQKQQNRERRLMYADIATGISAPVTVGINTPTVFGNLLSCTASISQGAGQAARTSDTIWLNLLSFHLILKYNFSSTVFAQDIIDTVRMTIFQWVPNTALVTATPGSLFQNVTSTSVLSNFDFELKNQYKVLRDEFFTVSGFYDSVTTVAYPTAHSIRVIPINVPLRNSRVDFTPSSTTAANHLYIAFTCDSVNGPAPLLQVTGRTYYFNDSA